MSDTACSIEFPDSATPTAAKPVNYPLLLLGGIILPVAALLVELTTRLSRSVFFDPAPTFFHVLLILSVPAANVVFFRAQASSKALPPRAMLFTSFATGIAAFYALLYLPLTPIAPFAMLWFGLGFVILAPMLGLTSLLLARRRQRRLVLEQEGPPLRSVWIGIVLALAALFAIDLPSTLTRIGVRMSASNDPVTSLNGIRFLRLAGSEDVMLSMCYAQSGRPTDLSGLLLSMDSTVTEEHARNTFYRVTGVPFNTLPQPVRRALSDWQDAFDDGAGGEQVAGRASGVSLASSRMDGSLDADAATSYLEWTMVFKNTSPMNQEARAEVALPPGAVVSRLTLWIDGEEREAAFGGRGQVRQAYQSVVQRNRDPVLVTTAGKDRVLVQLFPITPKGGEMKVRIGITAPMTLPNLQTAHITLPAFSERNFDIEPGFKHAVWIASAARLLPAPGLRLEASSEASYALRGEVADAADGQASTMIAAARTPDRLTAWSEDDHAKDGKVVVQTLRLAPVAAPRRVAIVVDGSLSMRAVRPDLIKALAAFPSSVELAVVIAGDGPPTLLPYEGDNSMALRTALANFSFEGGRDNSEALARAWDWAALSPGGAIVWIHGPQPIDHAGIDLIVQRVERQARQVTLYDMPIARGTDLIARKLDHLPAVVKVARGGTVQADLSRLFGQWIAGAVMPVITRERRDRSELVDPAAAAGTSAHLARLWAAGEIGNLLASGAPAQRERALALAVRYQLVTPVSGAVVLETAAQYKAAGLEPVPPGSVPTIPEPETWLMMIVALAVLAWRYRARRLAPAGLAQ